MNPSNETGKEQRAQFLKELIALMKKHEVTIDYFSEIDLQDVWFSSHLWNLDLEDVEEAL